MTLTLPKCRMALMALSLLLPAGGAAAADPYQTVVSQIAKGFFAPAYERIAEAALANSAAWQRFCKGQAATDASDLKARHKDLALAFAEIQSFTIGPIGQNSTRERLYFWPEKKNATAKGLAALLAGEAPITAERVTKASAAAQGIPALEQLIFGDDAANPGAQARRCEAGMAISANMASVLADIAKAWNGPEGYAAQLARGQVDPQFSDSFQQVATDMVTGFATGIASIQDQKLEPIIGKDAEEARPAQAEAHKAGLSKAMIIGNITGLRAFVANLGGGKVDTLQIKSWDAMLATLQGKVEALDGFPDGVTDPARRAPAEKLLADLKTVHHLLETEIPVALDLKLGFNGLDGD